MAKVLIVDDVPENRDLVATLLRYQGHSIAEAANGLQALKRVRDELPDLVICDILMPVMDGYEFVRSLRTDPLLAHIHVVFYSATFLENEARSLAASCGVRHLLTKPCEPEQILETVQRALAENELETNTRMQVDAAFDRNHLRLVTDKLAQKVQELEHLNQQAQLQLTQLRRETHQREQAEAALQAAERFSRATLDSLLEQICVLDRQGTILWTNRAWRESLASFEASSLIAEEGANYLQVCERSARDGSLDAQQFLDGMHDILNAGAATFEMEYSCSQEHHERWFLVRVSRFSDEGPIRIVVAHENITARVLAQKRADRLHRVSAVLGDINSLIVRATNRDELFREACRIAVDVGKLRRAWIGTFDLAITSFKVVHAYGEAIGPDFLGRVAKLLQSGEPSDLLAMDKLIRQQASIVENDMLSSDWQVMRETTLATGSRSAAAIPLLVGHKTEAVLVLYADEPNFFDAQEVKLLAELAGDMSFALEHLRQAEQLNRLAYYDALTGYANGMLFQERLAQFVATASQGAHPLALVLIDIEHFKSFNDSFGRHAGDDLLRQVADRVAAQAGGRQHIARVGADQFAAVIERPPEGIEAARLFADVYRCCFDAPFVIENQSLLVAAHMGIAVFPLDGLTSEAIFRNAEAAAKRAQAAKERVLFYDRQMTEVIAEKLALEHRLRVALQEDRFVLHYQPKVDCRTLALTGAEALIRWRDPELGLVSPAKFIPLLEETGLIREVGAWAVRRAVQDRRYWLSQGWPVPRIAVNVSAIQLRARNFLDEIKAALASAQGDPGIDIEITESAIVDRFDDNVGKLHALRSWGMELSIDDFGTGYSSLAYLARLPVQVVKIDQAFVGTMLHDKSARTLVSTMISLAHSLGMHVVAEGVEDEDQMRLLQNLGCEQMQGYLISKPLPPEDWGRVSQLKLELKAEI